MKYADLSSMEIPAGLQVPQNGRESSLVGDLSTEAWNFGQWRI